MDKTKLRNRLGSVQAGEFQGQIIVDNVAIALCTYFNSCPSKPDEEEGDDGWTPWVIQQVNATLEALAEEAMECLTTNG